jgi:hypothetical protein
VSVAVSVVDVESAGLFGQAIVTLNFEIASKGDRADELVITYWYSDAAGERVYEGEQIVAISGKGSSSRVIEVPFRSDGIYDIMIEAVSNDGTVATTNVTVNIPWITVNFSTLVVIAVLLVAASSAYVAYIMRHRVAGKGFRDTQERLNIRLA